MKVEYVNHMGDDLSVVNAARVSFAKQNNKMIDKDARLIRYLAKHNHWTPFSHTAITLRMGAPVPIRTQCFKHKAGFTENEESRRYISSRPEVFVPDAFRAAADSVKQGSGGDMPDGNYWLQRYTAETERAVNNYIDAVEAGMCPEQARFFLPQGCIVNWIWTGNLQSYARFYNQRTDTHAQKEVQELAHMVGSIVGDLYPVSWAALTEVGE